MIIFKPNTFNLFNFIRLSTPLFRKIMLIVEKTGNKNHLWLLHHKSTNNLLQLQSYTF